MPYSPDAVADVEVLGEIQERDIYMHGFAGSRDLDASFPVEDGEIVFPVNRIRRPRLEVLVLREFGGLAVGSSLLDDFTGRVDFSIRDYVQQTRDDSAPASYPHRDGDHFIGCSLVVGVANVKPTIVGGLDDLKPWQAFAMMPHVEHRSSGTLPFGTRRRFLRGIFYPE